MVFILLFFFTSSAMQSASVPFLIEHQHIEVSFSTLGYGSNNICLKCSSITGNDLVSVVF